MRMQGDGAMRQKHSLCAAIGLATLILFGPVVQVSAEPITTLRSNELTSNGKAPLMANTSRREDREVRNYPEQPPVIPHKIRGYQIDRNSNKCLTCHSRKQAAGAGAPMVSITHYMDRENQVRAFVTARRYFCNQCHVPQLDVNPLVDNSFEDADSVIERIGRK